MNLYAESSAVLAWLLGEDHGGEAQRGNAVALGFDIAPAIAP